MEYLGGELAEADIMDWALRVKAGWRNAGGLLGEEMVKETEERFSPSNPAQESIRPIWEGRVLPWILRYFPGAKQQLLAGVAL